MRSSTRSQRCRRGRGSAEPRPLRAYGTSRPPWALTSSAWVSVRLGFARLSEELHWRDMAVSTLAGVGFTVSLLIGELTYAGTPRADHVKAAVIVASFTASVLAAVLLHVRVRRRRKDAAARGVGCRRFPGG